MRVALDDHGVADAHRADFRHPAHVVARQVDQHHVFGALLGVGLQFGGQRQVFFRRAAALAGAGQRPDGDLRAGFALVVDLLLAHQDSGEAPTTWKSPKFQKYI